MLNSKFIKIITLSCFVILITGFVAYRSNVYERFVTPVNAGSTLKYKLNSSAIDSPTIERKDPAMLSTSKSMVLVDDKIKFKPGAVAIKKDTSPKKTADTSVILIDAIMYSSKSGIIFPSTTKIAKTDSQQKKIDTQPKTFLIEKNIMSSSKSMILASPQISTYTPLTFPKKNK